MFKKEKFRQLRKARRITQSYIAKLIGKSEKTVQRWESGKTEPTDFEIREIAGFLTTSVDTISDLQTNNDIIQFYYQNVDNLEMIGFDFLSKTDSEKQKKMMELGVNIKIQEHEIERLRFENTKLREISNSIDIIIIKKDRNRKITYVNDRYLSFFNISSRASVFGRRDSEIWNSFAAWYELSLLENKVFNENVTIRNEIISIPKFGDIKGKGIVTVKPLKNNSNRIEEILIIISDITGETLMREKFFYMESILNRMDYAICIAKTTPNLHTIYVNDAVKNIFNVDKSLFYKDFDAWKNFIHDDDKKLVIDSLKNKLRCFQFRLKNDNNDELLVRHKIYDSNINSENIICTTFEGIIGL